MSPVRVLFDEHLSRALQKTLRERAPHIDARRIGDPLAPDYGTQDPEILVWCEAEERILISSDFATLPVHFKDHLAAGHHCPGIIFVGQSAPFLRTLHDLLEILATAGPEDWIDRLVYLPLPRKT